MKFNGSTFNKAQQDQLKKKVGAELDAVVKKVEDVDARMLNYTGDWATGNEYHENDVVTWDTDGHLYEVIKAHTSSPTIKPSNTKYYKAMTASKYTVEVKTTDLSSFFNSIDRKSVVDIEMEVNSTSVHAMLMGGRSTSLIAFTEYTPESEGGDGVNLNIIVAHIVYNTVLAKQYKFDKTGVITTQVVTVAPSFTVTFAK